MEIREQPSSEALIVNDTEHTFRRPGQSGTVDFATERVDGSFTAGELLAVGYRDTTSQSDIDGQPAWPSIQESDGQPLQLIKPQDAIAQHERDEMLVAELRAVIDADVSAVARVQRIRELLLPVYLG